jgi:hypothetical protein
MNIDSVLQYIQLYEFRSPLGKFVSKYEHTEYANPSSKYPGIALLLLEMFPELQQEETRDSLAWYNRPEARQDYMIVRSALEPKQWKPDTKPEFPVVPLFPPKETYVQEYAQ